MSDAIRKSVKSNISVNRAIDACFQEWLDSYCGSQSLNNEDMEKEESLDNSFAAGWNYCFNYMKIKSEGSKTLFTIVHKDDNKLN